MSKDLNICTFVGRLTKDAQSRYSQSGTAIASFTIAVNSIVSDNVGGYREEPSFLDMVIYGKRAESLYKYLLKGQQVAVQTEARQNSYKRKDGTTVNAIEFMVLDLQLVGPSKTQQQEQPKQTVNRQQSEPDPDNSAVPF